MGVVGASVFTVQSVFMFNVLAISTFGTVNLIFSTLLVTDNCQNLVPEGGSNESVLVKVALTSKTF